MEIGNRLAYFIWSGRVLWLRVHERLLNYANLVNISNPYELITGFLPEHYAEHSARQELHDQVEAGHEQANPARFRVMIRTYEYLSS